MKLLYCSMKYMNSPPHFFLITALFFGIIYVFIVPPFQVPDEASHFFRTCHIAEGNLMGTKTKDNRLGGNLNESLQIVHFPFKELRHDQKKRIKLSSITDLLSVHEENHPSLFVDFPNTSYYSPTAYIPQVFTAVISKLFVKRPIILFYLIRLFSYLFWVVLIYSAIKAFPIHQWTITFLVLLPSSIFVHASLSADIITDALSVLLVAHILRFIFIEDVIPSFKGTLGLFFITSIILLNKVVYFPLIGLCILIPISKFKNLAQKIGWLSLLFVPCLLLFVFWYIQTKSYFISYDDYHPLFRKGLQINEGVHPSNQLSHMIQQPIRFFQTMVISFWESKLATIAHYIGKFGWEKNYLPTPLIFGLLLSVGSTAVFEKSPYQFSWFHRVIFVGIGLIMMLGLAMVMYLQWCPVGADRITNLSGRYFIPIFPLFFLALKNDRFHFRKETWIIGSGRLLIVAALSWSIYCVLIRYWW